MQCVCVSRRDLSSSEFLLVITLLEQDAANTKDDGQDAAQEDKIEKHARVVEDVVRTDIDGSPPRLVPGLFDIVMCAEMAFAIPVRYVVVEASLVARGTSARCVLRTTTIRTAGCFMLM